MTNSDCLEEKRAGWRIQASPPPTQDASRKEDEGAGASGRPMSVRLATRAAVAQQGRPQEAQSDHAPGRAIRSCPGCAHVVGATCQAVDPTTRQADTDEEEDAQDGTAVSSRVVSAAPGRGNHGHDGYWAPGSARGSRDKDSSEYARSRHGSHPR